MRYFTASSLFLALLVLAACDIPTEPEGIHEAGLTRLGEKMQEQGDDAGAVDFYQRALQRKPDDILAITKLGGILEAHGNIEGAESYYAHGLKIEPDNHDLLLAEGRVLLRLNRAADARDMFQKILDNDKRDAKAQNGAGVACDYLGRHDEAENHYQAALKAAPNDLPTLSNLAHSYTLAGKPDQAIALLEPHANDKNAPAALRQNLAEAYGMAGMYADAERLARVDLKPDEVKRNLAYYRAERAKLLLHAALAADLGSFPTQDMADANAARMLSALQDNTIKIAITPEVDAIGGTPHFALRASGFKDADDLTAFCQRMSGNGFACKAATGP